MDIKGEVMKYQRKPSKIKIDRRKSVLYFFFDKGQPKVQNRYRCKCETLLDDSKKKCPSCGIRIHWFGKARAKLIEVKSFSGPPANVIFLDEKNNLDQDLTERIRNYVATLYLECCKLLSWPPNGGLFCWSKK